MNAISFLSGITVATFLASAIFFLKFWRLSGDRFFRFFSVACILLALDQFLALFVPGTQQSIRSAVTDAASWVYIPQLIAFLVIMLGVLVKNRSSRER